MSPSRPPTGPERDRPEGSDRSAPPAPPGSPGLPGSSDSPGLPVSSETTGLPVSSETTGPASIASSGFTSPGSAVGPLAVLLDRWRRSDAGAGHRVTEFPEAAALVVLTAVLSVVRQDGGDGGTAAVATQAELVAAGNRWAAAHRSVAELVDRLSRLRELLVDAHLADRRAVDRAVDQVTAAAGAGMVARIEHLSRTDPLTGVGNRRAFDEAVQTAMATASRQGHEVTMVVVDLDGLKRINDSRGHAAGDAALGSLVQAFATALRGTDTVYRVGGDEFVVLLPFSAADQVELLMERVAAAGAPAFTWGAASFPGDVADAGLLFDRADRALYDRRTAQRAQRTLAAAVRPLRIPGVLDQGIAVRRWAWVPAAAVVAGAVALGVLVSSSGHHAATSTTALPRSHPSSSAGGRPPGGKRGGIPGPGHPAGPAVVPAPSSQGGAPAPVTAANSGSAGAHTSAVTPVVTVVTHTSTSPSQPTVTSPSSPGNAGQPGNSGTTGNPGNPGNPGSGTPGPSTTPGTGAGPVGALVAGVGQAVSGVPVVDDLVTTGPGGSVSVLGLVQLSGAPAPSTPASVAATDTAGDALVPAVAGAPVGSQPAGTAVASGPAADATAAAGAAGPTVPAG